MDNVLLALEPLEEGTVKGIHIYTYVPFKGFKAAPLAAAGEGGRNGAEAERSGRRGAAVSGKRWGARRRPE